jgi:hypothetical protein
MPEEWRFAPVAPNARPKWTGSWAGPDDEEVPIPLARILVLVPEEDGWGLYRYAADDSLGTHGTRPRMRL